jgi:hypothetical protein
MLWAAGKQMIEKWIAGEETEILKVPVVPFRGFWVFALILMCLLLLLKLSHHIKRFVKGVREN